MDLTIVVLSEAVDGNVCEGHHQGKGERNNIYGQSDGMVERETDVPSVAPDREAHILKEMVQVVEKDLLPPHAHGVAKNVVGIDKTHNREDDRDEVVDQHQMDGQPSLAEPFGSFTSVKG